MYALLLTAGVASLGTVGAVSGGREASADSVPVGVVFTATGGVIDANGLYEAGDVPGVYRLIATAGDLADTSFVTVTAPLRDPVNDPRTLPAPGRDRTETKGRPGQIQFEESERTEIVSTPDGLWITVSKHKKWVLFGGIAGLFLMGLLSRYMAQVQVRASNTLGFTSLNGWSAGAGKIRLLRA